jgi:2-(1,2-epoxy-1,2-dihydrophenyl)acetyl-CoA isomerase|tara:strand:- start:391 stop:1179 length:789 start_codon:yes stop_codon:yes gene_type:complete
MTITVQHLPNSVALVTLSAQASRNAFSLESMQLMSDIFDDLLEDPSIRSIVMTGTGRFFCSGADISAFASAIDDGSIADMVGGLTSILHPMQLKIRSSEKIFVVAINGAAAGGGLGIALCADYRVCEPNAKLAAAFFSLGLSPDGGTTWLLPRLVGTQKAKCFFFNNETWSGKQALEYGAVDEIAESSVLLDRAIDVAEKWGSWAVSSRRSTKQLIDASTSTFMETQLEFEKLLITNSSLTSDFAEGVSAFIEKRDPKFGEE